VTHPYRDTKEQGVVGFGKGVGRGVGGLVLKSMAAIFALPAYTLKGAEKQIEKRRDRGLQAELIKIRLRQGLSAFQLATEEEKQEVLKRWRELSIVASD
jgi:sterol 3beta-glucosyltransferase